MQTGTPTAHALKETGTGSSPGVKSQMQGCLSWSCWSVKQHSLYVLKLVDPETHAFFFALEKREADVNSLDCWCPPLTVLQE